ncbi:hypothetical protein ACFX1X_013046 [Malus domestica]
MEMSAMIGACYNFSKRVTKLRNLRDASGIHQGLRFQTDCNPILWKMLMQQATAKRCCRHSASFKELELYIQNKECFRSRMEEVIVLLRFCFLQGAADILSSPSSRATR